jgi:hypothetical protein
VQLSVRRTIVYNQPGATKDPAVATQDSGGRPILGNFSSESDFFLRDGQTAQSIMATDPHSGRVMKIEVTLNVVK